MFHFCRLEHYRRHKSKLFNYSSQSRTQSEIHGRTLECSGPPPPAAGPWWDWKNTQKKPQPNKQKTDLRSTWPRAPCSSDSSRPTRGSEVNGRREEDECSRVGRSCAWARKWEWRKLCGNPPHPPPFLALVHVKNVVKYFNTGGCLMSPLKEQSGV